MNKESLTAMAIEAGKRYLGREIVIQSSADFTPPGKRVARLVRHSMNCLLYTSPSPRDLSTSRMPSSA